MLKQFLISCWLLIFALAAGDGLAQVQNEPVPIKQHCYAGLSTLYPNHSLTFSFLSRCDLSQEEIFSDPYSDGFFLVWDARLPRNTPLSFSLPYRDRTLKIVIIKP